MTRAGLLLLAALAPACESVKWSQLSPSGSAPSARYGHTAVESTGAGGMLVFGGWGPGSLNDLHLYDPEANSWSQLSPSGSAPAVRRFPTAVESPGAGGILVFGGLGDGSYYNDLHLYDPEANSWSQLSPSGSAPSARFGHTAVESPSAGGMLVFGGLDASLDANGDQRTYLNDLHLYDPQANSWSQLSPSGSAPSVRRYHTAVESPGAGGMLVFGGWNETSAYVTYLNDLHLYDPEANSWSQLSPSGSAPSARYYHTAVLSPGAGGMLVFGGRAYSGNLNDLHLYDPEANSWSQLSPSGSAPGTRFWHTAVLSPGAGGMLVFGGDAHSGQLNDLHLYDPETATRTTTTTRTTTATSQTVTTSSPTQTRTTQTTTTTTSSMSSSKTVTTSSPTQTQTTQTTTTTTSSMSSSKTTTTTSSTSSSEGQLSCTEGQDVCAEVSFEGGARILKDVCFSAPCPVLCESATARKCTGPQGEEFCLPIAGDCPLLCGPGEVECYLENFDATGQRQEDSLQCVPQTELPCPCGRNARRCVDPRLGASCVAATEDCPTSCDSSRLCLSASFTPEGAFQELQSQCTDPSQPCACGENAKPCSWTDTDGLKRDECFPTATDCPLTCSKVCSIADYNRSTGELLGVRQTCANEGDVCPCGDFAFRCQDVCVPGNFPCPPTCSSEEQLCVRPSFDDQGEPLATEQVCVPQGGSCGCGQGAFECTHEDGSSECFPTVGGYCPVHCAGGVQCPLVTNFHPDGAEIGQWPPSRECANTTRQCPCGSEAKWCESFGCIFKDADCPVPCTEQQKPCSLVDYTSEGIFLSYREICIDADVQCPCGLNTWRCPGSDLCLIPSQMAICPCASWQKACEITDYSRTGIPESGTVVLCIHPELQCPCGNNALSCPDPMDSSRAICVPQASGVVANECPRWCSAEQLRAGNETCTQIFLGDSDSSVFKRISCRAPGDCKPGLNTKACPSGAFLPVWQPCPLGEVTEGTVKQSRTVEVAKVFWQLKTLSPNWAGSLTTAAVRLQFALAIPSTMETSLVLLPGLVLKFQLRGEGSAVPRGPKEFAVILRMQVQQGNPNATEAIALIGELDDRVGASIEISTNTIQIDDGEAVQENTDPGR